VADTTNIADIAVASRTAAGKDTVCPWIT